MLEVIYFWGDNLAKGRGRNQCSTRSYMTGLHQKKIKYNYSYPRIILMVNSEPKTWSSTYFPVIIIYVAIEY